MAWTSPRTWSALEYMTAALLNTHLRDNLNFLKNFEDVAINLNVGNRTAALATGIQPVGGEVPFSMTIQHATTLADQSTSTVVDIWVEDYDNYPPTDADSITASAPPTLTTATKNKDSTLTGWTTGITADEIFYMNIDSNDNATWICVVLSGIRNP